MDIFDKSELSDNVLAAIGSEAMDELENNEPLCLSELRSATNAEFRYKIIGDIDTGGMKSVYKAIDQHTCRNVALAFIKPEGLSEKAVRYFIHEAWVTARLEHPNIVPIHDVGITPDGSPFFVMKLLSGQTLFSIINKLYEGDVDYQAKFTRRHLLEIFIKICDAISYAHTQKVIHLDLKPENIQVSDFGQVLVLDWGIASLLQQNDTDDELDSTPLDEIENTHFGAVKGTPGYIAPELLKGQSAPDDKADIFGLGAILFSLLTYHKDKEDISINHPALEKLPPALSSVIRKAIQKDPALRYDSVIDLRSDVEAYLTGHATRAEDAGFLRQLKLLIERNRRIVSTIEVSLIILITVITTAIIRLKINKERAIKSEQRALKSAADAIKSERNALKSEDIARQLLKKYEQERIERERREKTSYTYYMKRAYAAFQQCRLSDTLLEVEQAIKMDHKKNEAYKIKMDVLIAQQKFQEVAENKRYKELPEYVYQLRYQLAEKYAQIKNDSRVLTNEELFEYFKDLYRFKIVRRSVLIRNIFYKINKGKTFSEQQQLINEAASSLFPRSQIKYDLSRDRLSIKTHSHNILALISGLNLKQLDLSGAKFKSFQPIMTLTNLEYLNLKNSKISTPYAFETLAKLKYLNLENTYMSNYKVLKKAATVRYLNIARTFIANYPYRNVTVKTLNAVEAFQANLLEIASSPNPPQTILITPAQLEKNKRLSSICKKRDIKVHLYNSADDVPEEKFFSEL